VFRDVQQGFVGGGTLLTKSTLRSGFLGGELIILGLDGIPKAGELFDFLLVEQVVLCSSFFSLPAIDEREDAQCNLLERFLDP
jgi:hypothetical protein